MVLVACGYEVQSILHFIKEIVQRCALYVQVSRTGNRGDTTSSTEGMTTPCTSFIQPVKNNKTLRSAGGSEVRLQGSGLSDDQQCLEKLLKGFTSYVIIMQSVCVAFTHFCEAL